MLESKFSRVLISVLPVFAQSNDVKAETTLEALDDALWESDKFVKTTPDALSEPPKEIMSCGSLGSSNTPLESAEVDGSPSSD